MNTDGSGVIRLIGHEFACANFCGGDIGVFTPAWSPDGRQIAFYRFVYDDFASGVYVMNSDGSDPRAVALPFAFSPSWSPDGATIAFYSWQFSGIGLVNADGSGMRTHLSADWSYPEWTPDGRLMFSRNIGGSRNRVFISEGASGRQLIPDAVAPAKSQYSDCCAVWAR